MRRLASATNLIHALRSMRLGQSRVADGYGSERLRRSSECARALWLDGIKRLGLWRTLHAAIKLPTLAIYLCQLQQLDVHLSDQATGLAIREHLALRRLGIPRFRLAQGTLHLPPDFAEYLRGRQRQALRTNIRRARERGFMCQSETIPAWRRRERGIEQVAPVERWWATDPSGAIVGEALVTVDSQCALLHQLDSREPYVRWLLHTAIVERLCASGQRLLLTNSSDVPLLSSGMQHFQHLLGYSIARLRPQPLKSGQPHGNAIPARKSGAWALATLAILGQHWLGRPLELLSQRATVCLTALIAVGVTASPAGWCTFAGAALATGAALLGAAPLVSVACLLCGVALEMECRAYPRIGRRMRALPIVGGTLVWVVVYSWS